MGSTEEDIRLEKEKTTRGLAAKLRRANDLGMAGVRYYKVDAERYDQVIEVLEAM